VTRTVCLHGPESSGKSTLAPRLAAHLGTAWVREYGREYTEAHGQDLAMADLVAIAEGQVALARAALADAERAGRHWLVLDTDPLMTIAWAEMLFGRRDPWFDRWRGEADLYLLMDIDLPFVPDPVRFFGDEERRKRFFDISRAVLEERGVRYAVISGTGDARWEAVLRAV